MVCDSLGQDFGHGSVEMALLCFLRSEASTGESVNNWGSLGWLGARITCRLFTHMFGTQAGLTRRLGSSGTVDRNTCV